MMAEVMIRRHTAPAHDSIGGGLNHCLCKLLQAIERMFGMGGEGLNLCIRSIHNRHASEGWLPSW